MSAPIGDREDALDEIRRTYQDYGQRRRESLWNRSNRGYARIAADRDRRLVELIKASLPDAGAVLDLGCGTGELADLVRPVLGDAAWTGVDLLPAVIEEAKRARPWAHWIEGSADRLPFESSSFDLVIASTLFSSIPSAAFERDVATEVARVLRPAGWVVWYDLRYDNPTNPAVHGIGQRRLRSLFAGWRIEVRSTTLLPPLARRLGWLTPVAYPVLEAVPPLRSHLIGRVQKPDRPS